MIVQYKVFCSKRAYIFITLLIAFAQLAQQRVRLGKSDQNVRALTLSPQRGDNFNRGIQLRMSDINSLLMLN